jgi:hypothetical protein
MWEDPIVKEVRKARLEIEQECGGDFRKIYERALKIQKKLAKEHTSKNGSKTRRLSPI